MLHVSFEEMSLASEELARTFAQLSRSYQGLIPLPLDSTHAVLDLSDERKLVASTLIILHGESNSIYSTPPTHVNREQWSDQLWGILLQPRGVPLTSLKHGG